jgi:hypothetical protein
MRKILRRHYITFAAQRRRSVELDIRLIGPFYGQVRAAEAFGRRQAATHEIRVGQGRSNLTTLIGRWISGKPTADYPFSHLCICCRNACVPERFTAARIAAAGCDCDLLRV